MKKRTTGLLIAALVVLPLGAQTTPPPAEKGVDVIVGAIETLEGKSDAKCHASATRLENFMYGTPLTAAARDRKVELQKELILSIWSEASKEAAAKGLQEIPAEIVRPLTTRALPNRLLDGGDVEVTAGDGTKLTLSERDVRQYSSVAYALRAILSVQQDVLLTPGLDLVPLSNDAVGEIKRLIDLYTLATLNLGDRMARIRDEKELKPETLSDAWNQLHPTKLPSALSLKATAEPVQSRPGDLLRRIIEQKMSSYEKYNGPTDPLFFSNIKIFYARHPWPDDEAKIKSIGQAFSSAAMDFVANWIILSEDLASKGGEPVVRERDVARVYDMTAPFRVNEFEDITFFYNLPKEKRLTIESYDADSFRDSGLHWLLVQQVINTEGFPLTMDFDPFAAELLAEGTAQMGVLLFREAGLVAKEKGSPTLQPEFFPEAERRILALMKEQVSAPAPKPTSQKLASSAGKTKVSGKFFDDITADTGIDFMHRSSDWLSRFQRTFLYSLSGAPDAPKPGKDAAHDVAPSFSGSGIASEDIDGDGYADILIVGGLGNKLYRNRGDGTFEDITEEAGINWIGEDGKPGEPRQPLIVDFDNDGRPDIFISYVNADHRLYQNLDGRHFRDVTASANLGGRGLVGGSACAFDFDHDGLLDIYIGYYGNYVKGVGPNLARKNFNADPNRLFRNVGKLQFKDVSAGSGIENTGWTQAVAAVDFDADGWDDLVVGNDFGVNSWYRNLGNGKFVDVAPRYGTDIPANSMNVGTSDLNGDGFPDIYISNILTLVKDEKYVLPTEETKMKLNPKKLATMRVVGFNHLFTSDADGGKLEKYELSDAIDRADTSTGWAWDADFFDFDNDGDDDLYVVNGLNEYKMYQANFEIETGPGETQTWMFSVHEKEDNVLFVNEDGKLENRSAESGANYSGNSRSAAYLDIDHDGDLDVVINNFNGEAKVLRNNMDKLHRHWIQVRLVGDPSKKVSRDAIGARLVITTPEGKKIWREVQGGTGYLSMHPKVQFAGLGDETTADVTIFWPDGAVQKVRDLEADRLYELKR